MEINLSGTSLVSSGSARQNGSHPVLVYIGVSQPVIMGISSVLEVFWVVLARSLLLSSETRNVIQQMTVGGCTACFTVLKKSYPVHPELPTGVCNIASGLLTKT